MSGSSQMIWRLEADPLTTLFTSRVVAETGTIGQAAACGDGT